MKNSRYFTITYPYYNSVLTFICNTISGTTATLSPIDLACTHGTWKKNTVSLNKYYKKLYDNNDP
jgi:hypothetical protein